MNRRRYAHTRNGTVRHIVTGVDGWYAGMMANAECGQRVEVEEEQPPTGHGVVFPVGTCQRCAANLNGTVRSVEQVKALHADVPVAALVGGKGPAKGGDDRSNIVGFRDGSPIRRHPDSVRTAKTMIEIPEDVLLDVFLTRGMDAREAELLVLNVKAQARFAENERLEREPRDSRRN